MTTSVTEGGKEVSAGYRGAHVVDTQRRTRRVILRSHHNLRPYPTPHTFPHPPTKKYLRAGEGGATIAARAAFPPKARNRDRPSRDVSPSNTAGNSARLEPMTSGRPWLN
ncbi:hypothetical protein GW17_00028749 [Ensete ventricosum]|nr:hypothetical protein GW17_00028749 [Ensete ventricosum]